MANRKKEKGKKKLVASPKFTIKRTSEDTDAALILDPLWSTSKSREKEKNRPEEPQNVSLCARMEEEKKKEEDSTSHGSASVSLPYVLSFTLSLSLRFSFTPSINNARKIPRLARGRSSITREIRSPIHNRFLSIDVHSANK